MKRIMIADDEVLVRIGIKSMVSWEDYGYTIVSDAISGEDALEKIRQYEPQIVLTDLKMQPMDGFELIERCAKEYPQIRFIVLSNYNDFDNVRRAMKLGACDYVFKLTVHGDELLKILDEASANLEEPGKEKADLGSVVYKNMDVLKNGLFRQAVYKEKLLLDRVLQGFEDIALTVDWRNPYHVLSLRIDNLPVMKKRGDFQNMDLLLFSVGNIIEELMRRNCKAEVFQHEVCEFVVILNREPEQMIPEFLSVLELRFQTLCKYIRQYFGFGISGSVCEEGSGLGWLRDAVRQNAEMLEGRFFGESDCMVRAKPLRYESVILPERYQSSVLEGYINQGNVYDVTAYVRGLVEYFGRNKDVSPAEIRSCLRRIAKRLNAGLMRFQIDTDELRDGGGMNLEEAIDSYTFYRELQYSVESLLMQYEAKGSSGTDRPRRREIDQARRLVREGMEGELTIAWIAEQIGMSESRFSHVFKEETGESFMEYVNAVRMEKAKELLQNTDLRIHEISEKIGIQNPNYFSAQYKKKTGQSPNEFRKSLFQQDLKEK